jgi:hypothetical protein
MVYKNIIFSVSKGVKVCGVILDSKDNFNQPD